MTLTNYRSLGKSGLIVSPLALGTMTFGNDKWGSEDSVSKEIFNTYIHNGGNFVDTADVYSGGKSEELVGKFIKEGNLRDQTVLATKFSFNGQAGNPNGGVNGRKNLHRAVEGSLKRLQTDYIDMYWMHVWDMVTPVEEMLQSLGELVKAGKIRYFGFSDMPAWYAAKAAALAKAYNEPAPVAQQLYYSLADRTIEQEHIPAALDAGQGIVPWSPLAYGFLTGKYKKDDNGKIADGNGRLDKYNPMFPEVTDKHWHILNTLREVAEETGHSMAQIALAWVVQKKGITATLMGISKLEQLNTNIASLEIELTDNQLQKLEDASKLVTFFPYGIFTPQVNQGIFGGHKVKGWYNL